MFQQKAQHKLGKKVLAYILICSSLFTLIATSIQLYSDYSVDIDAVEQRVSNIESSHLDALAVNLWDFQDNAIKQQLLGIVNLPAIMHVELSTPQGDLYEAGAGNSQNIETHIFEIKYNQQLIGRLLIEVEFDEIYNKLYQKAGVILLTQFFKTLIVAFCIMAIVHWLITRHIYRIAEYNEEFSITNLDSELKLDKPKRHVDELDQLVEVLNKSRQQLKQDVEKRKQAEAQLQLLNESLEDKVRQRTSELEDTLKQLTITKDNLVQAEKMAALGQLVAGVSHEINTPLGICITANSSMKEAVNRLNKDFDAGTMSKKMLTNYIDQQIESLQISERSLFRAVELMRSFKSVAVNQTTDSLLPSNMNKLFGEISSTVSTLFKRENYQIELKVDDQLVLNTYPGAWTQILTNLLMNSHHHGFENQQSGQVSISLHMSNGLITFDYQDNGCGIPEHILDNIFDPFVTSKRGTGGSGLGLNILFNLVYSRLQGKVEVVNLDKGCKFTIYAPQDITNTERKHR